MTRLSQLNGSCHGWPARHDYLFFLTQKKKKKNGRIGNWGEINLKSEKLKTKDSKVIKTQKNQKIQNSENTNKTGKVRKVKENPNFLFWFFLQPRRVAMPSPFSSSVLLQLRAAAPSSSSREAQSELDPLDTLSLKSLLSSSLCRSLSQTLSLSLSGRCHIQYRWVRRYVSWFPFLIFHQQERILEIRICQL